MPYWREPPRGTSTPRGPPGQAPLQKKLCPFYYILYKMENMRMTKLRALARECELRGYSKLRKAELIAFLQNNENRAQQQQQQQQQQPPTIEDRGVVLTKRQCKRRCTKDRKLAK